MVDSILASANRVPRVLLAHTKNTTRILRGPIRLLACTHPTPREFFLTCPRTVLYVCLVFCCLHQKADNPDGIPECGADAMRFALCAYTAQGKGGCLYTHTYTCTHATL